MSQPDALSRRSVRPRPLTPEVQRKVDRILAGAPKRQRISGYARASQT